jgi:hypothetical protein
MGCHISDTTWYPSAIDFEMLTKMPDKYTVIQIVGADDSSHGALANVFERELCSKCIVSENGESVPVEEISKRKLFLLASVKARMAEA